jgi:DNA-binding NtrC family response regulator
VLENGEYQRVGETQKRVSQARIIAATNRDLRKEVRSGNFRADLYHRLSVCSIAAPSLREMGDDRLILLDHFRRHYAAQTQQQPFRLSPAAEALFLGYAFPGNVRELRNIVIRLTTRHSGQLVDSTALEAELDLPDDLPGVSSNSATADEEASGEAIIAAATHRLRQREPFSLDRLLDATERGYIEGRTETGAWQRQSGSTPARHPPDDALQPHGSHGTRAMMYLDHFGLQQAPFPHHAAHRVLLCRCQPRRHARSTDLRDHPR